MPKPPSVTELLHQTLLGDAWENAEVGVAIFGDDHTYLATNEAFCKLTGYARAELVKLRAGTDLAGDEETRSLFPSVIGGSRRIGTGALKRKDGTVIPVHFMVVQTTVSRLPYFISLMWRED